LLRIDPGLFFLGINKKKADQLKGQKKQQPMQQRILKTGMKEDFADLLQKAQIPQGHKQYQK